jgi:multiple sugar transport system permease protein
MARDFPISQAQPRLRLPALKDISAGQLLTNGTAIVLGAIVLFYVLLPFYWMLKSSFQTNLEIRSIPPIWLPSTLSLDAYSRATALIPIELYMRNSLFVSLTTALIATSIAGMAAYVLARYRFPGATVILTVILFTQLIPAITRVFPIYFLIQGLSLLNTFTGLIMAYVGFSVPYAVLLLRGYFKASIPPELEEAALIDGCTWFGAFRRVVLPISLPGVVAVGTFTFLGAWNDFLWASLLLNRGQLKTIQVGLAGFTGELNGVQHINAFMAACVMATIPAMLLFFFVQRWMVSGLSAGAVK